MKISCRCGAIIVDQTDDLPHKAYLIPDQVWSGMWDAIDSEVIDPVADGQLSREGAYRRSRSIIWQPARLMWQCRACGRLYVDDRDRQLVCFAPEGEPTDHEVLRSRPSPADDGAGRDVS